jgi:hypothetical protein
VQIGVAVSGFETTEEVLNDEHSIGRVQPRFVAIVDTHAWNYQAAAFAEHKIGDFVGHIYGREITIDSSAKYDGKFYSWSSEDGRTAFALVVGSLIYFSNDETAIEKCLAVKRGEGDSFAKAGKLPASDGATLASGYVSTEGIAQIANIGGLKFAADASDDGEVRSAVAGVLPRIIRGMITEVSWKMTRNETGIEDTYQITLPAEIAAAFSETMATTDKIDERLLNHIPDDAIGVSQYNMKDPRVAFRSVVLAIQKVTDPLTSRLLPVFANSVFDPYGIGDGELFLSAVAPGILTVRFDDEDKVAAISKTVDAAKKQQSLEDPAAPPVPIDPDLPKPPEDIGIDGEAEATQKCVDAGRSKRDAASSPFMQTRPGNLPAVVTSAIDRTSAAALIAVISGHEPGTGGSFRYQTETRFTRTGAERKTVSEIGFIGWLIAELGSGN